VIPAILAGAVCLTGAIRGTMSWLLGGGLVMGIGIGAMHYIGMAAMQVGAAMVYDPWLFALSIFAAAALAIASLYTVRWGIRQTAVKPATALVLSGSIMGFAVTTMHYMGMSAVHFLPLGGDAADVSTSGMDAVHLAILVVGAILGIVVLAVVAVIMNHRLRQLRAAARAEAQKFEHLLEAIPDGIIGINAAGQIRLSNSRIEDLFRCTKESLLGQPFEMLMSQRADESQAHGSIERLFDAEPGQTSRLKLLGKRADRSEFPAEVSLNRISTGEGLLLICAIRDVTEQEQAREDLRNANERLTAGMRNLESQSDELRALTEMGELLHGCEEEREAYEIISNLVGQLLPDLPGCVYMVTRSRNILQSMASWGKDAETMAPVFDPLDCWALRRGRIYSVTKRTASILCKHANEANNGYVCVPMLAHGEVLGVLHVVAPSEGAYPANGGDTLVPDGKRILLIAVAEKIATAVANLRLREELKNQSIRDPLTGLLNRRFMEEALEREIVRASRSGMCLSFVAIDLDHFKRFNDTFGHEGGDLVLREVGAVLSRAAHGDNLACRLGGEELLLILPDTALDDAASLAEKLRRKIGSLSVTLRGQQLGRITASIGVAAYPRHGDSHGEVLRAADRALYRAKADGRNRVVMAERADDTTSVSIRTMTPPTGKARAGETEDAGR
jgi:diguanylate cyclase (GGDEF)-like protein/PAS domain S-box-containing protein